MHYLRPRKSSGQNKSHHNYSYRMTYLLQVHGILPGRRRRKTRPWGGEKRNCGDRFRLLAQKCKCKILLMMDIIIYMHVYICYNAHREGEILASSLLVLVFRPRDSRTKNATAKHAKNFGQWKISKLDGTVFISALFSSLLWIFCTKAGISLAQLLEISYIFCAFLNAVK